MYGQPPDNGGSRRRSPPLQGGSRRRSPPHQGRSRRKSRPQPREQHRRFHQNSDHIHSSQSQNYYLPQNSYFPNQSSNLGYTPFHQSPGFQFSSRSSHGEVVERVDRAVIKARRDLLEAGENVSAWKVSQAALVMLKVDSWDSLGIRMQQVPSLFQLIVTDGKINAFIHCFVAVQRITTLYDLEVAILRNEGVEQFEELDLGPLVKHPLIIHYFSISPGVSEVFRITSVEIISFLAEYMDADKRRRVEIDEFLNFITEKKSAGTTEKLSVRIQSLGFVAYFRSKDFICV
ncbi:hypothetical protein MTR67_041677 [Solanum verrucosum]|uniref:Uncharacterized protein n=1 Tax=Solanum verrucosum TaxID=315347 RepID=A0AAF0UL41_SOLVR|nr:hypothetical protein MTR67_041677 [Solanum verrucosum]